MEFRIINLPHRIEIIEPKKLAGFSILTSFQEDKAPIVWRQFMMRRNEIVNKISNQLFSLQIYPENFTPNQSFKKYALTELFDFDNIPEEFEPFELERGNIWFSITKEKLKMGRNFLDIFSRISFQKINSRLITDRILKFSVMIIIQTAILRKKRFGLR